MFPKKKKSYFIFTSICDIPSAVTQLPRYVHSCSCSVGIAINYRHVKILSPILVIPHGPIQYSVANSFGNASADSSCVMIQGDNR